MSQPEGIFFGMPEAEYRSAEGINISNLKAMGRSPAHYLSGIQRKKEATPAMIFGTILHGAILEPERRLHVVRPDGMSFQSKEGKAWRDSQELPIITAEDAGSVESCKRSINEHSTAREIIRRSKREVAVFKRDEATGLMLKWRLDCIMEDDNGITTIADIKTTDDASPEEFSRKIYNFDYHEQAAFYMDLIGASYFLFIAVEKEAPYAVNVFSIDADSIAIGRDQYRRNLTKLQECLDNNSWPSYGEGINAITLPEWAKRKATL